MSKRAKKDEKSFEKTQKRGKLKQSDLNKFLERTKNIKRGTTGKAIKKTTLN